jgi:hypothetical protein
LTTDEDVGVGSMTVAGAPTGTTADEEGGTPTEEDGGVGLMTTPEESVTLPEGAVILMTGVMAVSREAGGCVP